jgi:hypothetical protein
MAKPYIPKFSVKITREFDGKVEGVRSWSMSAHGAEIDKLEDCISFILDSAGGHIRIPPEPQRLSPGKTAGDTK